MSKLFSIISLLLLLLVLSCSEKQDSPLTQDGTLLKPEGLVHFYSQAGPDPLPNPAPILPFTRVRLYLNGQLVREGWTDEHAMWDCPMGGLPTGNYFIVARHFNSAGFEDWCLNAPYYYVAGTRVNKILIMLNC